MCWICTWFYYLQESKQSILFLSPLKTWALRFPRCVFRCLSLIAQYVPLLLIGNDEWLHCDWWFSCKEVKINGHISCVYVIWLYICTVCLQIEDVWFSVWGLFLTWCGGVLCMQVVMFFFVSSVLWNSTYLACSVCSLGAVAVLSSIVAWIL